MTIRIADELDPAPAPGELPARFPSPFEVPPHAVARRAAAQLVDDLRRGGAPIAELSAPGGGKMFGVLVVADGAGRIGALRGFSGMLGGSWYGDGFVPPLFDPVARDAFWPAGQDELAALAARHRELDAGGDALAARAALAAIDARHLAETDALAARHRARRLHRRAARGRGDVAPALLDGESRGDSAEARRLRAAHVAARAAGAGRVDAIDADRARVEHVRAERSRALWSRLHDSYVITSARGERRALAALFGAAPPPGGAGDCVAPKLLGAAYRAGLSPIAIAEVWWGASPPTGGRHQGVFYPACRGKCGPILAHMLDGLDAAPAPVFGGGRLPDDEPRPVYEDDWLVVVDKPVGLLSVPGRSGALRDSVLVRLRARYPQASGPLIVHRLDLDTSGLVLVAKDATTHAALQKMFACRLIEKRYAAWLDREIEDDRGVVELALRVDLDDRPRQIHDPVHGKPALTEWQVIERAGGRTRVALYPRTGRTHQLRVHAAHPAGIGAPIVGDRLYGTGGARLLLHAEGLAFVHPRTGQRVDVARPAPF